MLQIQEIEELLVKPGVRLKDIATVVDGLSDAKSFSSYNGQRGVTLEVKIVKNGFKHYRWC